MSFTASSPVPAGVTSASGQRTEAEVDDLYNVRIVIDYEYLHGRSGRAHGAWQFSR